MATTDEVEQKLEELLSRLDAEASGALERSFPEPRTLSLHVTDLDARYWTVLADGQAAPLEEGAAPDAHIRVAATSDDLVQIVDGGLSLFSAYVSGRVKIQASFADLMRLRKLA